MHVTAKPSSFQCNLKCDYCFYLEKESQFTHEKWMDDSTLKEFIKQYIVSQRLAIRSILPGKAVNPLWLAWIFSVKLFTINNAMQAKNEFLMHYKQMAFY